MSIKMRARLNDDLPFWFAMTSPLIGVLDGLLLVWLSARGWKALLETTIDADDNGLSLIVGTAI